MRDYADIISQIRIAAIGVKKPSNRLTLMQDAADAIEELLAVVPKRGEWLITDAYPHRVYCSVCYKTYLPNADWELWSDGRIPRNFCPHCGARMTEVSEDA